MYKENKILIGKANEQDVVIYPKMANRHGLIAGATGTGKTVTLKVLAESFSDAGVPVFMADVKGDLAGTACIGIESESVSSRVDKMGLNGFIFKKYPVTFWDVYETNGVPLRTTISEMGPLLMAQVLELNDVQTELLTVVYKIADDEGLLLLDTKDLKSMINYITDHQDAYSMAYGNISKKSMATIIRAIVALEAQVGEQFFAEPSVNVKEWFATDENGRGLIQILDCQKLVNNPKLYASFMLWLMSELFEVLPEAGDLEKPKMVFFFDEAHLLFDTANTALLQRIEQVVKLIRSKGVGIYFVTQSPSDIPDGVLGQLGNKIQHALHAYTPKEQKAAKVASESYRENPAFSTYDELLNLGIGEALVSVLDEQGIPTIVEKTKICPPQSLMGTIDSSMRTSLVEGSMAYTRYADSYDRESAYEILIKKVEENQKVLEDAKQKALEEKQVQKQREKEAKEAQKAIEKQEKQRKQAINRVGSTAASTIGRELGNTLGKTVGGSFGKRLGGNVGSSIARGIFSTLIK